MTSLHLHGSAFYDIIHKIQCILRAKGGGLCRSEISTTTAMWMAGITRYSRLPQATVTQAAHPAALEDQVVAAVAAGR